MTNWPIALLVAVVTVLLTTRVSMASACSVAALLVLAFAGLDGQKLIVAAAPNAVLVLIVMTSVQVAVGCILEAGAAQRVSLWIARATASRILRRVPATVLLPLIFVPTAMIIAAALHNLTAILLCAPIAIAVGRAYGVNPTIMLSAMLIASNLGGASMAFGDTPAIIQRSYWGFSCATFAAAMLPRNLVILFLLTGMSCALTWFPTRANGVRPREILERLRRRDSEEAQAAYGPIEWRGMGIGLFSRHRFPGSPVCLPKPFISRRQCATRHTRPCSP
jgi:Na+/H+ antiporter NhaD/arsenite permease-like protein